jgi:hypothetical protein
MPYYKSPQRIEGSGPNVEYGSDRPYAVNSYIVPPIDAGQPISLGVFSDRPGSTVVLLAPFDQDSQTIKGPVMVNVVFDKNQKGLATFASASRTDEYMLVITSYASSYTFYLSSVWSPFYQFRYLATFGFLALPFGAVMVYYDGIVERREKMIEQAMQGIKETQRK